MISPNLTALGPEACEEFGGTVRSDDKYVVAHGQTARRDCEHRPVYEAGGGKALR
jgi:hypothetical protein